MTNLSKTYKIRKTKGSREYFSEGTLGELIADFSYTLECGWAYQHEDGNKKIDRFPKTIKSLIKNLNNAVNNSAANGYAGINYELV